MNHSTRSQEIKIYYVCQLQCRRTNLVPSLSISMASPNCHKGMNTEGEGILIKLNDRLEYSCQDLRSQMVTLCRGSWTFPDKPRNTNSAFGSTCTGLQLSVSSSQENEAAFTELRGWCILVQSRHYCVINIYSLEKSEWAQVLALYIYLLTGSVFRFLLLVYISLSPISETWTLCLLFPLQKSKEPEKQTAWRLYYLQNHFSALYTL